MKNKKKTNLQADIDADYNWAQVKIILATHHLDEKKFSNWMNGQTCPIVEVDGKKEIGVYGWDLFRYIRNHTEGEKLIWD